MSENKENAPESTKEVKAEVTASTPEKVESKAGNTEGKSPASTDEKKDGRPPQRGRGGKGRRERPARQAPPKPTTEDGVELVEKVVFINRCAKVVKGGRRFSFSALMVSGTLEGRVGVGFGKANEVIDCIKKASEDAKRNIKRYAIVDGTIPHSTQAEYGGGVVLLKPACPGTGVIAGGGVRAVCEAVGIHNVLGKSLGSNNHANVVKATVTALSQLRTREEVLGARGKHKKKSK